MRNKCFNCVRWAERRLASPSIRTRKGIFPSIYMRLKSCSSEHKPFFGSFIMIGCIMEMFREAFLKEFAVHHSKWLIFLVRLYHHNEHTILHDSTTFPLTSTTQPYFLLKQTFKNCIGCLWLPLETPSSKWWISSSKLIQLWLNNGPEMTLLAISNLGSLCIGLLHKSIVFAFSFVSMLHQLSHQSHSCGNE